MLFPNSSSCTDFRDFVAQTILERVANGSLLVWGEVGKVDPPHLVMPITVEPSKPRMCHDERFLNCWIKDCPFSLDYITDLPRYVSAGHYQTTFDDKSGYDHVRLHPSSSTFLSSNGKVGILYLPPCHLDGRQAHISTIPSVWRRLAMSDHSVCRARSILTIGIVAN